jgi:hypothetical protein
MFKKGDLIRSKTWRDRLAIVICTSLSRRDLIRQPGHEVIQVNWITDGVPALSTARGVSLVREDKIERVRVCLKGAI